MNSELSTPVSFAGDSRTQLRIGSATSLRQLEWDEKNNLQILLQLNGSVWPRVWVFGVVNVLLTFAVYLLRKLDIIDLTSRSVLGHRYMVMVMSFLVVTRVKVTYDRYMADSAALQEIFRSCRELVNFVCLLTKDHGTLGPQYRHNVSLEMLKLVAITVQVLDFRTRVYEGKVKEIPSTLQVFSDAEISPSSSSTGRSPRNKKQKNRSLSTADLKIDCPEPSKISSVRPLELLSQACRAPILGSCDVAAAIMLDQQAKGTVWRHPCNEELRLLSILDDYLRAFHVLEIHMTTVRNSTKSVYHSRQCKPIPFPLVQMTKTFLFVWIFSLPFAMPVVQSDVLMSLVLVFLITYGFLGLEFVAMELTDCFGDDPSDLDKFGGAEQCYEDCYLAIYKCDGREWAKRLREGVEDFVEYSLFANETPSLNDHALI